MDHVVTMDSNHSSFENHIVDFHMKNDFAFLKKGFLNEIS